MNNSRVPKAEFTFRHHQKVQIRFNDIDILGHLNNSVYLQFMDLAKVSYFRRILDEKLDFSGKCLVIVNINCDFYSPTFLEENIEVVTATVSISEKSLRLEQRVVNVDNGDVKCLCHTIMAGFDPSSGGSMAIPDEWRLLIGGYEGRKF